LKKNSSPTFVTVANLVGDFGRQSGGSGEIFIRESAKRSFAFGQFGVKIETRDCESRGTPW
jgi:hypothetical protein